MKVTRILYCVGSHKITVYNKYFGEEPAVQDPPTSTPPAGSPPAGSPPTGTPPTDPPEETFTKQQFEHAIQKRLGNQKKEQEKLLKQIDNLQQSQNLTQEERDNLARQKDDLENSLLSEQEKIIKQKKQLENQFQEKASGLEKDRDTWKERFESSLVDRSLVDAATHKDVDATNPSQIKQMYRSSTYADPDKDDDGKELGSYSSRTKFMGLDKDGKLMELDLPTLEALQKIKKDGQNENLFNHGGTPGTGQTGSGSTPGRKQGDQPDKEDYSSVEEHQTAWFKWRDTHNLDGTEIPKD